MEGESRQKRKQKQPGKTIGLRQGTNTFPIMTFGKLKFFLDDRETQTQAVRSPSFKRRTFSRVTYPDPKNLWQYVLLEKEFTKSPKCFCTLGGTNSGEFEFWFEKKLYDSNYRYGHILWIYRYCGNYKENGLRVNVF